MSAAAVRIKNANVVEGWTSFQFNICEFDALPTTKGHFVLTPKFSWNGHNWALEIYPSGDRGARDGFMSIYLCHRSEGSITATFEVKILDKFGKVKKGCPTTYCYDSSNSHTGWGWNDFTKRSNILDKSQNILDSNGTLAVVVSMKEEPTTAFVPKNPLVSMIREMFLDEETADVCFEIISRSEENENGIIEEVPFVSFHAHSLILKTCAPMLAALFGSPSHGEVATASITDIKPEVFRHLLWYVYGGRVPQGDLKTHAIDIIEAADKYSVVNLKLEAEAAYVQATTITTLNALDNLLYADAKNCALLKEVVIDFLADNSKQAAQKVSFTDVPGHLMKDLLVAFNRKNKNGDLYVDDEDKYSGLRVSELRRTLYEKGLGVDGSREAMIEAIKANAEKSGEDELLNLKFAAPLVKRMRRRWSWHQ